jgi:phosphatidylglycerophosphate synthase
MMNLISKKIPTSPNTITVIGFSLLSIFLSAVMTNNFILALIALFVGATLLTVLKEKQI